MSSSDSWFRRHRKLTLAGINILFLVAVDFTLGAFLIPPDQTAFRRPDPVYHHGLLPSAAAETGWGEGIRYPFFTNSLGFRDRARRDIPLESSSRRILFMGDSFVEGVGVPYEESFVGLIEDALAPDGVEVLNAGVIGYSPKVYALKTKHLLEAVGLRFDEMVLFIDMSDIPNEIIYRRYDGGIGSSERAKRPMLTFLRMNSFVVRTCADRLGYVPTNPLNWNGDGMPFADDLETRESRAPDKRHWTEDYEYAEEGFRLADENIDRLLAVCRRHGVEVTLAVYPWPANLEAGETDHVQVRHWRAFCEERGVRFIDLFQTFFALDSPGDHFIEGDSHWNVPGHRVVADELLEVLR